MLWTRSWSQHPRLIPGSRHCTCTRSNSRCHHVCSPLPSQEPPVACWDRPAGVAWAPDTVYTEACVATSDGAAQVFQRGKGGSMLSALTHKPTARRSGPVRTCLPNYLPLQCSSAPGLTAGLCPPAGFLSCLNLIPDAPCHPPVCSLIHSHLCTWLCVPHLCASASGSLYIQVWQIYGKGGS